MVNPQLQPNVLKEVLHEALPGELDEVIENLHKVRSKLNGNFEYKVKKLNKLTEVLIEKDNAGNARRWRKIATYSLIGFGLMLIGHFIFSYIPFRTMTDETVKWYQTLDKNFHWMVLAGFLCADGRWCHKYGLWCYKFYYFANGKC